VVAVTLEICVPCALRPPADCGADLPDAWEVECDHSGLRQSVPLGIGSQAICRVSITARGDGPVLTSARTAGGEPPAETFPD
jgi:hypothetical protein